MKNWAANNNQQISLLRGFFMINNSELSSKQQQYDDLVREVAFCQLCDAFKLKTKKGEIIKLMHDRLRKHINLWSHWQGSLNAEILLIGQDWGRISNEEEAKYWADKNPYMTVGEKTKDYNVTDINLRKLFLNTLGIDISLPNERLFFTNSVQCYKTGSLSNRTSSHWHKLCNENFVKRLISIIKPKLVIPIGRPALNGLRSCGQFYTLSGDFVPKDYFNQKFGNIVDHGFLKLKFDDNYDVFVLPLFHCGVISCNVNQKFDQQLKDWEKIKEVL
jgi:uracil-DNA glycosylase